MECKDGVCELVRKEIVLGVFEQGPDYVTLEWLPRTGVYDSFQMEWRLIGEENWMMISDSLKARYMKKKGLKSGQVYEFRARGMKGDGEWSPFSNVVQVNCVCLNDKPTTETPVAQNEGKFSIMVHWNEQPNAKRYCIEMRRMQDNNNLEWKVLSDQLQGTSVKKKNLDPAPDYVFRYKYNDGNEWSPYSLISFPIGTPKIHHSFQNLLGDTLLTNGGRNSTSIDCLAGKIVLLYFSGYFCPPCHQQTAMMKPSYQLLEKLGVEVVFISADRNVQDYAKYFGDMPWLGLPYDSPKRMQIMQIMQAYQISAVPKLMVFSPSAQLISDNVAGVPITPQLIESWKKHP